MFYSVFRRAPVFALGVLAVVALQATGGWWLDSGQLVLRACAVLFTLGVFMGLWRSEGTWIRACALWAGAIAGSTGVLLWTGPGNIWPIVLAFAAVLSAAAVFTGAVLGVGMKKIRHS
jgi:hypothetical protein